MYNLLMELVYFLGVIVISMFIIFAVVAITVMIKGLFDFITKGFDKDE